MAALRSGWSSPFVALVSSVLVALGVPTAAQAAQVRYAHAAIKANAVKTVTFVTIDDPADPTFNQLLGINDTGTIVGDFGSGVTGHQNQAFASAPPYGSFVPLKFPAAGTTRVTGVGDDGSISGFWSPTSALDGTNYGFLDWNSGGSGIFLDMSVNDPLLSSASPVDQVLSFNHGVAIGMYDDINHLSHGFAYTVKTGTFLPIDISGATSVVATGMSETGITCGFFTPGNGQTIAFLKPLASGSTIAVAVPGSVTTEFLGISGYAAVGFYAGANGVRHGLVYNLTTNTYTTVDDPNGANGNTLDAINDKKQAVGYYKDSAGNSHGLLASGF